MKEAFYFSHDNNAHNDPKIMSLLMWVWLSWVWLYWILIELFHQQEDWIISEEQFMNYLQWYSLKQEEWFVEQVLNTFKANNIFCFEDWNVYSKRVLKNKEMREELSQKRREAWKISAQKRALQSKTSTSVEQKWTSVEQGKERKGKERKGKERKHKHWEYKNVLITDTQKNKFIDDFWEEIFNKYIKTVDEYIQVTWKVYKDHNLVMRKFKNNDKDKTQEKLKNDSWRVKSIEEQREWL